MAKLRWTREAEQWLKDIHEYIARENLVTAQKVIAGIYDKTQLLREFPELGQKYRSESKGIFESYSMAIRESCI